MIHRTAGLLAALLFVGGLPIRPAAADNQMGYRLVSPQDAATLPRRGGALGLDLVQGTAIHDGGMTFELLKVSGVRRGSPGAQAGFHTGDQLIAVDGQVFSTLQAFAAYVGSVPPGRQITVDYIPAGGGPQQAQRVGVTVGGANGRAQAARGQSHGMSTGAKVAIGVGAAALFGCYELGCFEHKQEAEPGPQGQQPGPQPVR